MTRVRNRRLYLSIYVPQIRSGSALLAVAVFGLLTVASANDCRAETFIVSDPLAIEDAALRDREFADWSFGGGIVLEVGFMPGLYEEHHCASLVRFDLSGLPCERVQSAMLRLYKPKCFAQITPVPVYVHEVAPANAGWTEGTALCQEDDAACSWGLAKRGQTWAGDEGCSRPGVDFLTPPLDTQAAPPGGREWLEFAIPPQLVQQWLDDPATNAGLYLTTDRDGQKRGDHAFFHSSEHASGNGPQLVIEGTPGTPRTAPPKPRAKRKHLFPPSDAAMDRWFAEADNRYVDWTRATNMTRDQARMIYYYDVTVRGEMLMPYSRIPLTDRILQLDRLIPEGDEEAVREVLREVRKDLLYWEYIREAHWYDSGPTADVFSPLQLGILWGQCLFGKMLEQHAEGSWRVLTAEEIDDKVTATVELIRARLELTPEQAAVIDPVVAECERLEHEYMNRFREDVAQVQEYIRQGRDDDEMLNRVKSLHMNHELFLYYQSTFNTPRWTVFMENARAVPLAREFIRARRSQYNPGRTGRQIEHASRFASPPAGSD